MEEWKTISGYDSDYEVSNIGNVRYDKKYILPTHTDGRYLTVNIRKNGKRISAFVHRLVAIAFIPNKHFLPEVNHKNEIKTDNRVENLEWCTHKYNCNYGTRMQRIKEKQNIAVLQYTLSGKFIREYASMHIAADAIDADAGHICDCCSGNRSRAYGYFWRYKDNSLYVSAKEKLRRKKILSKKSRSEKFTNNALNVVQLKLDGTYIRTFRSSRLAAESVNSHRPMIINCCNGKRKDVKGYKWMYEKDYKKLIASANKETIGMQLTLF